MKIHSVSKFKDPAKADKFLADWYKKIENLNNTRYERIEVETALGKTIVWGINANKNELKTLVVFPGFRTCGFFWDFDNGLAELKKKYRIYLVDINGQPCLSDGNTPDIKSNDYGIWAAELMTKLGLAKASIAGASFGGLVCLKLCLVAPEMVENAILLNPGCLQPFSMSLKNLYYNLLPLITKSEKSVVKFLDNAVFYGDNHKLSLEFKRIIIDYELFAINEYIDKTQKPYPMSKEDFAKIKPPVYLILGDKDILFPTQKSRHVAETEIKSLKKTFIVPDTGHGIETSKEAMRILAGIIG